MIPNEDTMPIKHDIFKPRTTDNLLFVIKDCLRCLITRQIPIIPIIHSNNVVPSTLYTYSVGTGVGALAPACLEDDMFLFAKTVNSET